MKTLRLSLLLVLSTALTIPSFAQTSDNGAVMERIDKLDHDMMLLQRQVSRGTGSAAGSGDASVVGGEGAAQLEVRLTAMEEEMRTLRGKVEENDFQVHKLSDTLEKMQHDTDFRFNELTHNSPPPIMDTGAPEAAATTGKADKPRIIRPVDTEEETAKLAKADDKKAPKANESVLRVPDKEAESNGEFATPRDHYNYAFRLMNQTQYDDAAASFEDFTKKYPKDPLIGNAYYWLGESFYIRHDYVSAADNFRQGFEAIPTGPKAGDNLLKLAMSLNALKRDKEACVVLQQVLVKFKKSSASVAQKAEQEQKRIGCK